MTTGYSAAMKSSGRCVLSQDNVTYVLLLTLGIERVMHSLVCQEIGRESREIIRPCIRVTLAPRAIELEDNNCAAPSFRSSAGGDMVDGPVNGRAPRQCSRGVP